MKVFGEKNKSVNLMDKNSFVNVSLSNKHFSEITQILNVLTNKPLKKLKFKGEPSQKMVEIHVFWKFSGYLTRHVFLTFV